MKTKCYTYCRLLLLSLLFLSVIDTAHAQQVARSFTAADGTFMGFLEYKPVTYNDNPTKKYPLIIFLHGIGERGNGTTDLGTLTLQGIPKLISQKATMTFTNPNTGEKETFLVLSPQLPKSKGAWENIYVDEMLKYAKANLRVDENKIFLTGLSLGGGGVWAYANTSVAHAQQFAAIAPVCGVCFYNYSTLCSTIATANIGVWGFTNADDNVVSPVCTVQACDALAVCNPSKIKKTVYQWGGHDSWTKAYDTSHTIQTDINVYEWFLANAKGNITPQPNQSPVANAGNAQTITLPVNSVNLNGAASTDPDGSISSYSWSKQSGPVQGAIANTTASATNVSNLVEGIYVFKLTVTDNRGATSSATIQVTVNAAIPAPNQAPVANAGPWITITLPVNSVTLNGTASSDADGTISSYSWTKFSGPSTFNLVTPAAATTAVNNLIEGVYVFKLTVTDNRGATSSATIQVTVNAAIPAPNQAPVANAGPWITITLPVNSVTLNGTASSDADGTISTYSWTKFSGPSTFNVVTPAAATTAVNNLAEGVYVFKLTVTDNNGATSSATIQVTVNAAIPAPNQAPVANAGPWITITLPVNSATLNGTASSDADGTISSYSWTKFSGPSTFNVVTPAAATTAVNNLTEGVYVFKLTVTDNRGATSSATIQVTVNAAIPAPNQAPVANAGPWLTITLPVNSATLNGSTSSDADGTISSYSWTKFSGPSTFNVVTPTAATTVVNNLTEGVYVFKLTVTDNRGATSSATIQVTVNAATPTPNQAPVANAGPWITITLPVNSATLNGTTSSDADGTISTYSWTKFSGPSTFNVVTPAAATTVVNNLTEGVYIFKLTVTDNKGSTNTASVQVTVNAAVDLPNQSPVSNAGNAIAITLPQHSVTLSGSASNDPDGSISAYSWTKVSGPASSAIVNPSSVTTVVNNLTEGDYVFKLVITDNKGATASATVDVKVHAAVPVPNKPPVAHAGEAATITLPLNTAALKGNSSTDADGSIVNYSWSKVSGPSQYNILNSGAPGTTVNNLLEGVYVFKLIVTDNLGASASATVNITVLPKPNALPVAQAGSDRLIAAPAGTVTLDGSASYDTDGQITAYAWKLVSGNGAVRITNSSSAKPTVEGMVSGDYRFQLTVTDNVGAIGVDELIISVNGSLNRRPKASAGKDSSLSLPATTAVLNGSGSFDADGNISSYTWRQLSGPAGAVIEDNRKKTTVVSGLTEGEYVYTLSVADDKGLTAADTVNIMVINNFRVTEYFSVYPNPARSLLNIRYIFDNAGPAHFTIYTINGTAVKKVEIEKKGMMLEAQLDITELRVGFYYVELRLNDGKKQIKKFLKR